MDRRVKYTKRVLNESLIRFLEKKEITKITVTEICQDADVNRSTYYAHFADPYDHLAKLKAELLGDLAEYISQIDTCQLRPGQIRHLVLGKMLEYVETKKEVFRTLLRKGGDHNLQDWILEVIGGKAFRDGIPGHLNEEEIKYLLKYASNGCFGLFYDWLMAEQPVPAEKMSKMMADFTGNLLCFSAKQ